MEYFSIITGNEKILTIVAFYAGIAWVAANTVSIKSFLSKKHELELIKLKLEINASHVEQFNTLPPYGLDEISAEISSAKEHRRLIKGLFWLGGHIVNLFYWLFSLFMYICGAFFFLNIPFSLWFHEELTFLQGITMYLIVGLLTAAFNQTADLFREVRDGMWENA